MEIDKANNLSSMRHIMCYPLVLTYDKSCGSQEVIDQLMAGSFF